MKKVKLLALAAAFVLGLSGMGNAAELKVKGEFQAHGAWSDNLNFRDAEDDNASEDDFRVLQRMRVRFQYVQSETLQAVLHLETGDTYWGRDNYTSGTYQVGKGSGGGLSADGVSIEVKNAYLDFNIPDTLVNVKVGIQGVVFPGTVFGNQIMDDDVAGVVISAPINEMVGVTFAWLRPIDTTVGSDGGDSRYDEADALLLAIPITPEGMKITPWGAVGFIGEDAILGDADGSNRMLLASTAGLQTLGANGFNVNNFAGLAGDANTVRNAMEDSSMVWWAGLAFELSMFDPFVLAADFQYGKYKNSLDNDLTVTGAGTWDEISTSGWLADLSLKYKGLGFGTPELFGVYASGNGEDALDEGKFGVLPTLGKYNPTNTGAFAIPGGFYYGGSAFASTGNGIDPDQDVMGTWAFGLALRDFSFLDKLTHTLMAMYIGGTHDEEFVQGALALGAAGNRPGMGSILSTKDHLIEVDFNHQYKIYEQLSAILELGYLKGDFDEDVWGAQAEESEDAWRVALGLVYKF